MKYRTAMIAAIAIGMLACSALGVAAQDEGPADPVEVTAKWAFGDRIRSGTGEAVDGVWEARGFAWQPQVLVEASDPRLRGTLSVAVSSDDYDDGPWVASSAFRIENQEGTWQQTPTVSLTFPGVDTKSEVGVLVGERGYEGLIAVLRIDVDQGSGTWDLHGYILDGELPPPPGPVVTES